MHVTFVKKVLADGTPCQKCRDVEDRLKAGGYWSQIDAILVADEREPDGAAWALAREFNVKVAPFFVVRDRGGIQAYSIFLQLVREVLEPARQAASA